MLKVHWCYSQIKIHTIKQIPAGITSFQLNSKLDHVVRPCNSFGPESLLSTLMSENLQPYNFKDIENIDVYSLD